MKKTLILLSLLSLTACNGGDSKPSQVETGGGSLNPLTVKLIRSNPFPVSATMVGSCDETPAIGCRVDDSNSECNFSCDGTATITLEQNTDNGCQWAVWNIPYGEYDEEGNNLVYRSTANDSNLEITMEFYGCD